MPRMMMRRGTPPRRTTSASPAGVPTEESAQQQGTKIPKTNLNPVWSLCPWPVMVDLPGKAIEIPAMPAVNWLQFLMAPGEPDMEGLLLEFMPEVEEYYLNDEVFDVDGLNETLEEVISTVAARPWWQVIGLTRMAIESWDALGPLLLRNHADPTVLSLAAWLDVLIVTVLENTDKAKATMFTLQLESAPPSEDGSPAELPVTDRNEFFAMAAD